MKRHTETKLDKIVRIGMSRIDHIFDRCCDDLDALKPKKVDTKCWLESDDSINSRMQRQAFGQIAAFSAQREMNAAGYGGIYDQLQRLQHASQMGSLANGSSPLGSLLRDANSGRQGF